MLTLPWLHYTVKTSLLMGSFKVTSYKRVHIDTNSQKLKKKYRYALINVPFKYVNKNFVHFYSFGTIALHYACYFCFYKNICLKKTHQNII